MYKYRKHEIINRLPKRVCEKFSSLKAVIQSNFVMIKFSKMKILL